MAHVRGLHLGAATTPPAMLDSKGQDSPIAAIDDPLDLWTVVRERFVDGAHVAADAGVADILLVQAYPPRLRIRVEPNVGGVSREDRLVVARHPAVVDASDDLDVLVLHARAVSRNGRLPVRCAGSLRA